MHLSEGKKIFTLYIPSFFNSLMTKLKIVLILLFSQISFLILFLQDPDPPPQEMNAAPPLMFNPMAFSQPKAQASPRKSRYPGIRKQ